VTLTRAQYEKWLGCLTSGKDVGGTAISVDAQSDMYLSVGLKYASGAQFASGSFYIDDLVVNVIDRSLDPIVGYQAKDYAASTTVAVVERVAGDNAAQVTKTGDAFYAVFGIDAAWLAEVFADANTTAVSFKLYSKYSTYRTGGSYNNSWYQDANGALQRTSWGFTAAPSKTDGYFLVTLSRNAYESWLTKKGDVVSDMYLSIGFYGEGNTAVRADNFYIDDIVAVKN
jgi:hypothetical protein